MPQLQQALPKYVQIANHVRDQILRGDLRPGDEVPSERTLAAEWKVSRPTATKALETLRVQGLVGSRQGAGTFVLDKLQLHRRARERYGRARETGTVYPPNEWAEIVAAEVVETPAHVAEILGTEASVRALRRHRIINGDDGPVEVSTSWYVPSLAQVAPRLLEGSRIREGTLAYVEAMTGRRGRLGRDRVSARLATEAERDELRLGDDPQAVLIVQHVVYDGSDEPLEFAEAVYPPGRWTLEQEYPLTL